MLTMSLGWWLSIKVVHEDDFKLAKRLSQFIRNLREKMVKFSVLTSRKKMKDKKEGLFEVFEGFHLIRFADLLHHGILTEEEFLPLDNQQTFFFSLWVVVGWQVSWWSDFFKAQCSFTFISSHELRIYALTTFRCFRPFLQVAQVNSMVFSIGLRFRWTKTRVFVSSWCLKNFTLKNSTAQARKSCHANVGKKIAILVVHLLVEEATFTSLFSCITMTTAITRVASGLNFTIKGDGSAPLL